MPLTASHQAGSEIVSWAGGCEFEFHVIFVHCKMSIWVFVSVCFVFLFVQLRHGLLKFRLVSNLLF